MCVHQNALIIVYHAYMVITIIVELVHGVECISKHTQLLQNMQLFQ